MIFNFPFFSYICNVLFQYAYLQDEDEKGIR